MVMRKSKAAGAGLALVPVLGLGMLFGAWSAHANEFVLVAVATGQQRMGGRSDQRDQEQDRPSQMQLDLERKRELEQKKKEYEKTKNMAADLVKASGELKSMIDQAGENTLPLNAIKKAEEIESMARKIKSRLKGT